MDFNLDLEVSLDSSAAPPTFASFFELAAFYLNFVFFSRPAIVESSKPRAIVLPAHGNNKLPPEILDLIFHYVIDAVWYPRVQSYTPYLELKPIRATLKNSSLVCRSWCGVAQRVLWESVSIESSYTLFRIMEARDTLKMQTRYLDVDFKHLICNVAPFWISDPRRLAYMPDRMKTHICNVVRQTSELQELYVDGDVQELTRLLCSCETNWPYLRTLSIHVHDEFYDDEGTEEVSPLALENLYINTMGATINRSTFTRLFQNSFQSLASLCVKAWSNATLDHTQLQDYIYYLSNFKNLETLKLVDVKGNMISLFAHVPPSVKRLILFYPSQTCLSEIIPHVPPHVSHIELTYILRDNYHYSPEPNSPEEFSLAWTRAINSCLHDIESLSIFMLPSYWITSFAYSNILERDWMQGSKKTVQPPHYTSKAFRLTKELTDTCKTHSIKLDSNLPMY